MWVVVLSSKGEAVDVVRSAQATAEAECGCKRRVLRTNNGEKFTAAEFASYCMDEGVQCHYSAVERRRQAAQPDGCGDGSGPPQAEGNVDCVLRRGGGDSCLNSQPLVHQGYQSQDAL
jgi:hypothetical protein